MLVVADTSPLHYLVLIQHDAILPALYERVALPPAVLVDLQHSRTPQLVRAWAAHRPAWLEVRQPRQVLDARCALPHNLAILPQKIASGRVMDATAWLRRRANRRTPRVDRQKASLLSTS